MNTAKLMREATVKFIESCAGFETLAQAGRALPLSEVAAATSRISTEPEPEQSAD